MKSHEYGGHFGLRRLDSSLTMLSDAQVDPLLALITVGDLNSVSTEAAIATQVSPQILSKPQKRAIEAWFLLTGIAALKGVGGGTASACLRSEYDGPRGLKKMDPSI